MYSWYVVGMSGDVDVDGGVDGDVDGDGVDGGVDGGGVDGGGDLHLVMYPMFQFDPKHCVIEAA